MITVTKKRVVKKIKLEMKQRLGVCQIYFHLDSQKMTDEFDFLRVIIEKNKMNINLWEIRLPCNVVPQSLNGLSFFKSNLTFRIHLNDPITEPDRTLILPCNYREPTSELKVNEKLILRCMRCNSRIFKKEIFTEHVTFEVTDLIDVSDIFCHRKKEAMKFEKYFSGSSLAPRIHFDTGSFKLMHTELENLTVLLDEDVLHCQYCFSWLGVRSKNEEICFQFWCDTVKLANSPITSQNLISKNIFYELVRRTLSDYLFTPCNFDVVCKISSKRLQCISLTILDKTDPVHEYDCEVMNCTKPYLKTIFEEKNQKEDNTEYRIHQSIFVSKPTFCYALRTLYTFCDTSSEATSKIAYLPI